MGVEVHAGFVDFAGGGNGGGDTNHVIRIRRKPLPLGVKCAAAAGIHSDGRDIAPRTRAARHSVQLRRARGQSIIKTLTVARCAHKFNHSHKTVVIGSNDVTGGKSGIGQSGAEGLTVQGRSRVDIGIRSARRAVGRVTIAQLFGQIGNVYHITEVHTAVAVRINSEIKITTRRSQRATIIVHSNGQYPNFLPEKRRRRVVNIAFVRIAGSPEKAGVARHVSLTVRCIQGDGRRAAEEHVAQARRIGSRRSGRGTGTADINRSPER